MLLPHSWSLRFTDPRKAGGMDFVPPTGEPGPTNYQEESGERPTEIASAPLTPSVQLSAALQVVERKHREFFRKLRFYGVIYYMTRCMAVFASALLPFVVGNYPSVATAFSVCIVLAIGVDSILDPKRKWKLYVKATNLLAMKEIELYGQHEKYRPLLDILVATEEQDMDQLTDLKETLQRLQEVR